MSTTPLVSVIIAAFNAEAYLEEAITSVFEQDWESLEVVVVDDGSTDGTAAVARRFGPSVTVSQGCDEGLAATRNRGMATACGSFFLHLDADDVLLPNAIRLLMDVFESDQSCDISAGQFSCFSSPEVPPDAATRLSAPTEPQRGHISGVALSRAEVFARVGLFDGGYQPASDMEWWLRARDRGVRIQFIDELVLHRRIHGNNSSLRNGASHQRAALRITREALKRKRSGTS